MIDEPKVWIRRRVTKGKPTFHLRWVCPIGRRWKSRKVGTDKRVAAREATKLELELSQGTYREIERIGWDEFVADHIGTIGGRSVGLGDGVELVCGEVGELLLVPARPGDRQSGDLGPIAEAEV